MREVDGGDGCVAPSAEAIAEVGLSDLADVPLARLSGGGAASGGSGDSGLTGATVAVGTSNSTANTGANADTNSISGTSGPATTVNLDLAVSAGTAYKLQLLFQDDPRGAAAALTVSTIALGEFRPGNLTLAGWW